MFPLSEARRVAARLQTNGMPVELRVLPGEGHSLGANRSAVVPGPRRALPDAAERSGRPGELPLDPVLAGASPAAVALLDAGARVGEPLAVVLAAGSRKMRLLEASPSRRVACPTLEGAWLAWARRHLTTAAVVQTALHLVPPRLPIDERTLTLARKHLVAPKEKSDFEFLAAKPCWPGKRLRTLLEHVELAHYNRELINWKLDEQTYQQFVLSPEMIPSADGGLNWRRPLWENFLPPHPQGARPGGGG